ncbi:VWA domain-containing protein [Planotetraspora kaengkrachanensis]|uniref:Mg-protoporphyrin IX chelatase n=1 Tax=Planotetraspora kaengkrachanensis TaxID=575193 RepID=A0A8J3V7G1_9ACTN|nr:VWA domain-containing protein [Planotetraspora kaengkrachanensis]GIG81343.1 magnesium chelatase [Planotetraspora kaengkrachanensis]
MIVTYPFSAVVGLDDLKLALVLNAVSPRVGGVLVRGEKGTAKSTIVRALAAQLPGVAVVGGCRFSCDPAAPDPQCPDGPHEPGSASAHRPAALVELPVGASEDRLVGSLDLERALTEGVKAFEPGLLAAAHRGVLYVDEVNLLHDHLVDLLLDAAALGTCYVERESVSVRHAARFLLVGTMNPEEGELRPQLLDRFGLTVEVKASRDPRERAEVVRRRLSYDADPEGFAARWTAEEAALASRIAEARMRLGRVRLPDARLRQIATVCAGFEVDGLRADLVTANAAIAHAAWQGRDVVTTEDVRAAARLSLPHRRRRDPFDAPGLDESLLEELLAQSAEDDDPDDPDGGGRSPGDDDGPDGAPDAGDQTTPDDRSATADQAGETKNPQDGGDTGDRPRDESRADGAEDDATREDQARKAREDQASNARDGEAGDDKESRDASPSDQDGGVGQIAVAGRPYKVPIMKVPGIGDGASGRRSRARTPHGRTTGSRAPGGRLSSVHLTGTLLAAAPYQRERGRTGPGLVIRDGDLREAVREGREGNLVLFVVDASGSMAARKRMTAVKTAVLSLLLDAYQRRDKVGLVTFRGSAAHLALPPTSSVEAGAARLRSLPTGGRTPLAEGLTRAAEVLRVERLRDASRRPLLIVVTDGRATSGGDVERAAGLLKGVASVVVDCETGPVRLGLARRLAFQMRAQTVPLDSMADLGALVREYRGDKRDNRDIRPGGRDHRPDNRDNKPGGRPDTGAGARTGGRTATGAAARTGGRTGGRVSDRTADGRDYRKAI